MGADDHVGLYHVQVVCYGHPRGTSWPGNQHSAAGRLHDDHIVRYDSAVSDISHTCAPRADVGAVLLRLEYRGETEGGGGELPGKRLAYTPRMVRGIKYYS